MSAFVEESIFAISNPFGALASRARKGFLHIHDHFIPHPRNNYIPHILGHRSLSLLSLLLLSVKVASIALLTVGPVLPAYSSAITTDNIFSLTNQSRQSNGLANLSYNQTLAVAAQNKAQALLECGCFQHNLPDGRTPWDFIKAEKYNYLVAGENLAVDFTQAETVEDAWMNSPGHRANILNKNYEEIGVGITQGTFQGHNAIFVVQMFGTPLQQKITPLNSPTVVAQSQSAPVLTQPAIKQLEQVVPKAIAAAPKTQTVITTPPVTIAAAPVAETQPAPTAPIVTEEKPPIQVVDGITELVGNQVRIFVTTAGQVTKVVANFSNEAILLQPKSDTTWEGFIDINKLVKGNKNVSVVAADIFGHTTGKVLGGFSSNITSNYNLNPEPKPTLVNFFGWTIDPKLIEYRFYLLFVAVILSCLVLAIAIRRHVQHISIVTNGAFVAIFAMLIWTAR